MHLLQDYELYNKFINTEEDLKVYVQSVKTQIHLIEIKLRKAKTNLGITERVLNHENEIWQNKRSQKVQNKQKEVKKSCTYYYNLKRLLGEWLIAIDHVVQNDIDLVDILGVI